MPHIIVVGTINYYDKIPASLKARCHCIEIAKLTAEQKIEIFKNKLIRSLPKKPIIGIYAT